MGLRHLVELSRTRVGLRRVLVGLRHLVGLMRVLVGLMQVLVYLMGLRLLMRLGKVMGLRRVLMPQRWRSRIPRPEPTAPSD